MSAYYAAGGPAQRPSGLSPLMPVQVSFSGPAPQSRVTVAFRLLLAVPHIVILLTMAVGAGVVAFTGWFGALFTGRLPVFAADFARMGSVTSASKYAGMASSAGVEQAGEQFDVDYDYLMNALGS
jgi:hypothetical protein